MEKLAREIIADQKDYINEKYLRMHDLFCNISLFLLIFGIIFILTAIDYSYNRANVIAKFILSIYVLLILMQLLVSFPRFNNFNLHPNFYSTARFYLIFVTSDFIIFILYLSLNFIFNRFTTAKKFYFLIFLKIVSFCLVFYCTCYFLITKTVNPNYFLKDFSDHNSLLYCYLLTFIYICLFESRNIQY